MKTILLVLYFVALLFGALPFGLAQAQVSKNDPLSQGKTDSKASADKEKASCSLCFEHNSAGNMKAAMDCAEAGLAVARQNGLKKDEAECLFVVVDLLNDQSDYPQALKHIHKSLKIFEQIKDANGVAKCLYKMGSIYQNMGDYSNSAAAYEKSLKQFEKIGDPLRISSCIQGIGILYMIQGDYPQALEHFHKSLKIKEQLGDQKGISYCLNNIGIIYDDQKDYPLALKYFQRSRKIKELLGDLKGIASCLNNIGNIYLSLNNYPEALKYYHKSLKIKEQLTDPRGISLCLMNIGTSYSEMGDYTQALKYHQKSLEIKEQIGDLAGMSSCFSNVSSCYLKSKQPALAQFYAREGFTLAQKIGHLVNVQYGAKVMYMADSALGNWKAAFKASRIYHIYSDSLKNDEQSQELGRLESKAKYEKEAELAKQKVVEEKRITEARNQWIVGSTLGGLLLVMIIALSLFRGRQKEKKANVALRELNEEINQQKSEIEAQNVEIQSINSELQATLDEVNQQRLVLEEQHLKIEDSIRYASRIQNAIMPAPEQLIEHLPPHFIHYQPRDIVSGDFYWMTRCNNRICFAAVDCTGHGVPGAFMSVLGSNLLHQIVDENQITEPDVILAELDHRISATLHQSFGGDSKDGMDLALMILHPKSENGKRIVEYAGAGRPLWHLHEGKMTEYKSAKYSCGGSQHEEKSYPASRIEVTKGDRLYIFSDGPVDQFGGPKGRKLGSKNLQTFLVDTSSQNIEKQGEMFDLFFNDWMKNKKQLDDVLLVGFVV